MNFVAKLILTSAAGAISSGLPVAVDYWVNRETTKVEETNTENQEEINEEEET